MSRSKTIYQKLFSVALVIAILSAIVACDDFSIYGLLGGDSIVDEDIELQISPVSATVPAGAELHFFTRGGTRPYAYVIISGNGTIDEDSGVYIAPATASVDIVRVIDADATYVDAQIVVVE